MNIRSLPAVALTLVILTFTSVRADTSRFWDYYTPHPTNYIGSPEWWQGDDASGDWWGMRNMLEQQNGVDFSFTYTNNIAGNPVGGKQRSATYTDNVGFGVELDLEKLAGWKGGILTVSGLNRSGQSLSQIAIGNQFTVQQVFGGQTAMYYALAFEQKLLDDKVDIKLGRFATGDDFASSPIYWLYMNNGIDGNPQALPVNTQFSAYPWAVWAARVRVQPTPEVNAMVGAYQVSTRVFDRAYHGVDWSIRPDDGVLLIAQAGWTPEFFKKSVPAPTDDQAAKKADGKSVADGKGEAKTFKETATVMKGLPGHYWFGAYYSPWQFAQFGATETTSNSYGFYWHADQMIYQESPGSDQGLTIWSAIVLSPQQNIAKLPFEVNGGLAYKGLIPSRDSDETVFGVVYGKFSSDYARATQAAGGGYPDYELVFEVGHRVQFNSWLYVQPNLQYVINPGGAHNIPNALVLGAQCSVTF
ncbi:MAG: carbohydrate porin [Terrimicrobiaceae bacterium]|nr:carbohydrate porin [Terrimicrobiaceae bacterium]